MSGYKITFFKTPFQKFPRFTQSSGQEAPLISQEVNELLQKGAIERTPFSRDGFYSHLFLVTKKDGPMRPVIDLSYLNKFILNKHFQMENLSCLKTLLLKGDFMTNIDLKDAYLSVPVHQSSQKFLRFIWEDTCYQLKALPFGLCSAPRIFTKLMKPIAAFLRRKSIRVLIYLDDFLLLAATKEEAVKNTHLLITLLQSLGFIINFKKSSLTPSQVITFLGFKIDSTSMMLSLPAEKINKILDCAHRLLAPQRITLRNLASLIGLLETSRPANWRAPLHFRHLQCDLIWGLQMNRESYDALITLSTSARGELAWWLENTRSTNGSPVHLPPPDMLITTDASMKGWGAVHHSLETNGRWSQQESLQHINYLELKAAFLALKNFSQRQVSRNRFSANRQHNRHRLYQQERGYTFPPTPDPCPGIVGLVPGKRHLCDSFSHPGKRQRLCRQGVEIIQGYERVEVRPIHHPTLSISLSDRPVRESPDKPTEGLHQLETRPRSHPHRRLHDNLGSSARLCLSSIQLDIQNSGEGNDRTNRDNSSCPNLANPALVAGSVEASNISAGTTAKQSNPPNRPVRSEQSSPNVSSPSLGRVSHLYQRFQAEGIPSNVADLLIAATRTSTHKTYESSWNRWCRWCSGRQIDPLSSSINDILTFLTEVFNEGLAYRSINVL